MKGSCHEWWSEEETPNIIATSIYLLCLISNDTGHEAYPWSVMMSRHWRHETLHAQNPQASIIVCPHLWVLTEDGLLPRGGGGGRGAGDGPGEARAPGQGGHGAVCGPGPGSGAWWGQRASCVTGYMAPPPPRSVRALTGHQWSAHYELSVAGFVTFARNDCGSGLTHSLGQLEMMFPPLSTRQSAHCSHSTSSEWLSLS